VKRICLSAQTLSLIMFRNWMWKIFDERLYTKIPILSRNSGEGWSMAEFTLWNKFPAKNKFVCVDGDHPAIPRKSHPARSPPAPMQSGTASSSMCWQANHPYFWSPAPVCPPAQCNLEPLEHVLMYNPSLAILKVLLRLCPSSDVNLEPPARVCVTGFSYSWKVPPRLAQVWWNLNPQLWYVSMCLSLQKDPVIPPNAY
jgi:hypothetical protein